MISTETTQLKTLEIKVDSLTKENVSLKEQLEWCRRQIFGQRSERIVPTTADTQLFLEGFGDLTGKPAPSPKIIPAHTRKTPVRDGSCAMQIPEGLPVERVIIDLPDEEKVCAITGAPLVKIGEEVSRKLAHIPGSFYIKEIVRPKYALPKGEEEEGIRCAALPDSLLPRCQADESLLAEIMVRKFGDHAPLYRTEEIFAREGVRISRQLLSQWVINAGLALEPLYEVMKQRIIQSGNVYIDESPVSLLAPGKGKTQKAYMWVLVGGGGPNPPYRIYDFQIDRKHCHATDLLENYKGVFHSDKYKAYEQIAKTPGIIWCPCWAHIRRKFVEATSGDLPLRDWVLRKIRYLYLFERIAWARSPEERLRIRLEKEVPIIDELIEVIKKRLVSGTLLPKSKFREALGYFCGLIPYLKNYTKYADAHIDNNVAERAVRPLAIGRKNWLFMGSDRGGRAGAIILSLVQSCRGLDINPRVYLEDVMRRIMSHNSQKLDELLPDRWLAGQTLLPTRRFSGSKIP